MPRYLVERTFPEGWNLYADGDGVGRRAATVRANAHEGVTWVHSYVAPDRRRAWCICDGPSPEAIRAAANATGLPVDRITDVRVVDPYFLQ
jgi:hypothetical protein